MSTAYKLHPALLERAGKGRPPGSVNTMTRAVAEAIAYAFEGIGGVHKLMQWAEQFPTEFYTKVWIKLMPKELNVSMDKREMRLDLSKLSADELAALLTLGAKAGVRDAEAEVKPAQPVQSPADPPPATPSP